MALPGIKTRFTLDGVDISTFLDSIQGSSDTDFLDGTTFQPDAVTALKNEIPGFSSKGLSLGGKWSEEAEAFFSAREGQQGLAYIYRPAQGSGTDQTITGTASLGSYSGPQSSVDGIITFTAELRVQTRSLGGSPA